MPSLWYPPWNRSVWNIRNIPIYVTRISILNHVLSCWFGFSDVMIDGLVLFYRMKNDAMWFYALRTKKLGHQPYLRGDHLLEVFGIIWLKYLSIRCHVGCHFPWMKRWRNSFLHCHTCFCQESISTVENYVFILFVCFKDWLQSLYGLNLQNRMVCVLYLITMHAITIEQFFVSIKQHPLLIHPIKLFNVPMFLC